jgi:hypothetical protein
MAKQGVVRTRDGRTIEGDVTEKADQVVVVVKGIQTTINRDNVSGIEYFDSVEQQYEAKKKALPKNPTAADHLGLARWLLDQRSYDLSLREVHAAQRIDPNSADAMTLEQTVMAQRRLDRPREGGGAGTGTPAPRPPANTGTGAAPREGGGVAPRAGEGKFLTPEDIGMIRKWEWKDSDNNPPRVTVTPDVRRRYVNLRALNPGEFAAMTMPQQAWTILTDREAPADMKREIRVTSDPQSLADFRRTIQPLIVNNCATAGCHGGNQAGDLFLYHNNTDREEVAYTNFYILRSYFKRVGDRTRFMIDPGYPDESILAQFALHPDAAELDHPELKGQTYKAMAPNRNAPAYVAIINWMRGLALDVAPGDPKKPTYWIQTDIPGVKRAAPAAPAGGGAAPAGGGAAPAGGGGAAPAPRPAPAGGGAAPAGGGGAPPAGGAAPPARGGTPTPPSGTQPPAGTRPPANK